MKRYSAFLFIVFALFAALLMAAWNDPASRDPLAVPLATLMIGACLLTITYSAAGHNGRK